MRDRKLFLFTLLNLILANSAQVWNATENLYSPEEKMALTKLRDTMGDALYVDYMQSDPFLIRWIRDQNWDLDKAKQKLMKSLEWRKENRVDSILNEDFSDVFRRCPVDVDGKDVKGRPVLASVVGKCQLRMLSLRGKRRKIQRAIIYLFERLYKIGRESKFIEAPEEGIVLADMSGISLREHTCLSCISILVDIFQLYINNYPEMITEIYMVNVSRMARNLYYLLTPFAPKNRREKIFVYGFNKNEWDELRKKFRPEQLTFPFGGTRKYE